MKKGYSYQDLSNTCSTRDINFGSNFKTIFKRVVIESSARIRTSKMKFSKKKLKNST